MPHDIVVEDRHGGAQPHAPSPHVIPWWRSARTRPADVVPLCASCPHDLHEGHRTLRLRDRRLLDHHGWATPQTSAA